MRRPIYTSQSAASAASEDGAYSATPMERAGLYLKELRRARKLTQSTLAEAVGAGRGTIERLESGDDHINVGTVLRVLKALSASPWHYFELAMEPKRTLDEICHKRAIMRGIVVYIRVLAERKRVAAVALDEVTHSTLASGANSDGETDITSPYALLLALIYLDAPLADLAPIVRAAGGHEALGRQLAESRGALSVAIEQAEQHGPVEKLRIPAIDAVVTRVSTILRSGENLPGMLRHELARVEADLKRYRALALRGIGDITAEP
jgi:transcriptional regulator with XRE-family HTH domain